jgi:hypothetical protein
MLTVGHTKIDAVLTTYRTILAETIDTLAGAQGEVAALTADLAAARASLEAANARIAMLTPVDADPHGKTESTP